MENLLGIIAFNNRVRQKVKSELGQEMNRETNTGNKRQNSQGRQGQDSKAASAAAPATPGLYEVEIAGVPLRLKSSHDSAMVQKLVGLVNTKIDEALPLTKTGSIQNASILASLHLAEELLNLKEQLSQDLNRLENKTQSLLAELERT